MTNGDISVLHHDPTPNPTASKKVKKQQQQQNYVSLILSYPYFDGVSGMATKDKASFPLVVRWCLKWSSNLSASLGTFLITLTDS
jgi:hypothetical protein